MEALPTAFARGLPVLCEKPMTPGSAGAPRVAEAAARLGRRPARPGRAVPKRRSGPGRQPWRGPPGRAAPRRGSAAGSGAAVGSRTGAGPGRRASAAPAPHGRRRTATGARPRPRPAAGAPSSSRAREKVRVTSLPSRAASGGKSGCTAGWSAEAWRRVTGTGSSRPCAVIRWARAGYSRVMSVVGLPCGPSGRPLCRCAVVPLCRCCQEPAGAFRMTPDRPPIHVT